MKTDRRDWIVLAAAGLFAALTGCGGGGGGSAGSAASAGAAGKPGMAGGSAALAAQVDSLPLAELSDAERAGLLAMREEEQLAHDVYAVSAAAWALPIFANIAASETAHASAVANLLDRYDLPDPMVGQAAGVFPTPAFQALYDALVARSRTSLIDALKVGCEIEELDMRDIAAHGLEVDNADIRLVYEHLLRGSRNHLRSFYTTLFQQGGSYTPLYLGQEAFDAIVTSAMESGA